MLKQLEPQIKTQGITKAVIATITTVLTFATAESSWAQTTCTVNSTNIVVPSNSTSNQGSVTANSGQIINITVTNNGSASGALFINIQPNLLFSDAISPGSTLSTNVATSRDEMGDLVFNWSSASFAKQYLRRLRRSRRRHLRRALNRRPVSCQEMPIHPDLWLNPLRSEAKCHFLMTLMISTSVHVKTRPTAPPWNPDLRNLNGEEKK